MIWLYKSDITLAILNLFKLLINVIYLFYISLFIYLLQYIHIFNTTPKCMLPVKLRVEYKILTLVFKALNNLAPIYLTELLQTHKSVRPLRSRFLGTLSMPRSRLKHRGDRAFVIVGPTLWNNLPVAIRTTTSLSIFKVMLKSHLLDRFAANQWRVFVSIYWDFIIL